MEGKRNLPIMSVDAAREKVLQSPLNHFFGIA